MKDLLLTRGFTSHSPSNPTKTNGCGIATPSIYTDQQVDIAHSTLEEELKRVSLVKAEKWASRTATKKKLVERARRIDKGIADKLAKCCSSFVALTCGVHTTKLYPTYRCKKLFCPDCASERANRLARQTESKVAHVMRTTQGRLCFLTLTTRNTPTLEEGLSKLKKVFAKFKRKKVFKKHIKGYFGGFEYTFNPQTKDFHVHLHLIILRGKFWNQSDISDTWREVTGDSFIVDIREIRNAHKGVKELCKYIVKPLDLLAMPNEKLREVMMMKSGTRMFVSGGCFYNVKLDDVVDENESSDVFSQFAELKEGDPCPMCNEELFNVIVSRNSAVGLYQLNTMPNIVKNNSS
jgi:hypothetical protein